MKLEDFVVTKFDTSKADLVENLPYVLENTETKERLIGTLRSCDCDTLTFYTWKGVIIITTANAGKYNIYKADSLTDEMHLTLKGDSLSVSSSDIPEEKLNEIKDAVDEPLDLSQAYGGYAQAQINAQINIVCHRIIDYRMGKTEADTIGIENFYEVKSEVTIIKQFLYKVNRVKDNYEDMIQYAVKLPVSESDKKEYMDEGWKIHPMFYNKENGCYMPSVRIKRPMQMMECDKDNSITLQILSGLQMLHLVEYGLNEKDKEEPGKYAGIDYTNNGIIISNSFTDENNRLFIDGEETVLIKDMAGYISKFLYWNNKFDWLFFPKETVRNVYISISDSEFVGPSMGVNNIIKWGNIDSDNFGIFNYWMHSTEASENDYIIPWEFGE